MLVLTRKKREAIKIDDHIEIKILAIDGDQVKLGIEAPQSVEIHRKEIYLEIQKQNCEAAQVPSDLIELLYEAYDE